VPQKKDCCSREERDRRQNQSPAHTPLLIDVVKIIKKKFVVVIA
jgi:hypothetical protein